MLHQRAAYQSSGAVYDRIISLNEALFSKDFLQDDISEHYCIIYTPPSSRGAIKARMTDTGSCVAHLYIANKECSLIRVQLSDRHCSSADN